MPAARSPLVFRARILLNEARRGNLVFSVTLFPFLEVPDAVSVPPSITRDVAGLQHYAAVGQRHTPANGGWLHPTWRQRKVHSLLKSVLICDLLCTPHDDGVFGDWLPGR